MRVAVLYAGEIRTWEKCRQNQLDNIQADVVDLYFYTYEEPLNTNYKMYLQADLWDGKWDDRYDSNRHPCIDTSRMLKAWSNMYNGFHMIPNYDQYDVYIRSRCDIVLQGRVALEGIDYSNKIYIPVGNDYEGGVNDQFAFGSYDVMRKYFDIHVNHPELFSRGLRFHTEFYIYHNLISQGVEILRTPQTNYIVR